MQGRFCVSLTVRRCHQEACTRYHQLPLSLSPRSGQTVYEADRHAKKELKKQVRGVRPIESAIEKRTDDEATIIRKYCLAVRSALTDDGHPPLTASGLKLHERLTLIAASLERVAQKGAYQLNLSACIIC